MPESLLTFVVGAFAACQLVEVIHHGSIFRKLRDWGRKHRGKRWLGFPAELVSCPFCLSHWAGAAVVILLFLQSPYTRPVAWWLAVVRGANLLNDLLHAWCRSPPADSVDDENPPVIED